jgi:DNA mismatch repair protein MSH2
MPDFHRIAKKFHRKSASLEDVVRVFQAIKKVRRAVSHFQMSEAHDLLQLPRLVDLLEGIEAYNPISKELLDEIYIKPLQVSFDSL